ncbi:NAD-dependent deacetylase hst3 [Coemansia sp. S155-1]|nr:NAD-dependent deacetylase hst3 [Coemansia sp. S155-1]
MEHLSCQLCSSSYHFSEQSSESAIRAGDECPDCQARSQVREACGRRSLATGKLRPTVVLYEEPHPHCEDIAKIISHDARALGTRRSSGVSKQPQDVLGRHCRLPSHWQRRGLVRSCRAKVERPDQNHPVD